MSWRQSGNFARETGDAYRFLRGMVRRVLVTLSSGARWQFVGRRDRGDDETLDAEVFGGIGMYARPAANGAPEAIAVGVGDTKATVVVATRDEATRQAVANLAEDETAIFNSQAIVVVKANGTVEVRLAGGEALALALKSDVEALRTHYIKHVHPAPGGATSAIAAPPAAVVGTTVLKGQ